MNELEMWLLFFPYEETDSILDACNAKVDAETKQISKAEFFKVIGLLYAMSTNILHTRREYWSAKTENQIFPSPSFGKRFGMGYHRFEFILNNLAFSTDDDNDDRWKPIKDFINMIHVKLNDVFRPGYKLCADESMFAWYGRGNFDENGMPAVIKIKRKPKGIGCEAKTLADADSNIMIRIELNEGKDLMSRKKWQAELGAGTATILRLTEPWHGTGRIIVADSWFASVKTALELEKRGLFFIGIVKTATKQFPMKILKEKCPEQRGATIVSQTTINDVNLISCGWRDKKIHTFVGSCSTTLDGIPAKKMRTNENGQKYTLEVPRIKIIEEYFQGAPSIDVHNHLRQSGLALEEVWHTQNWKHRLYASLLGIIETNAYLAFKYFKKDVNKLSHADFTKNLAYQLVTTEWETGSTNENRAERSNNNNPATTTHTEHSLIALSTISEKQRVQRKCVICSRIRKVQQKASYFCQPCGQNAVLCAPTTGRNCFSYHILHGVPSKT